MTIFCFILSINIFATNVVYANPLLLLGGAEFAHIAIASIVAGSFATASKLDMEDIEYITASALNVWDGLTIDAQNNILDSYKNNKKIAGKYLQNVVDKFNSLGDVISLGDFNINAPIVKSTGTPNLSRFKGVSLGRKIQIGADVFTIQQLDGEFYGHKIYAIKINNSFVGEQTKYKGTGVLDKINSTTEPFFFLEQEKDGQVNLKVVTVVWDKVDINSGISNINIALNIPKSKVISKPSSISKISTTWEKDKKYAIPNAQTLKKIQTKEVSLTDVKLNANTKDVVVADTVTTTATGTTGTTGITGSIDKIYDFFTASPTKNIDFTPFTNISIASRFPFSLATDLKNLFKSLKAPPTPPKFTISFNNKVFVGGTSYTLDFTIFNKLAVITRWGILIAFNIALIILTTRFIL